MKTRRLSKTEKDIFGADFLVTINHEDVAGFTDDTAAAVLPVPQGVVVSLVAAIVDTPLGFSDADVLGCNLKIGDADDDDRYLESSSVFVDQTPITKVVGTIATNRFCFIADGTVDVTFTLTIADEETAGLDSCTSGQLRLYFSYEDLNQLPRV